jgi:hypothetical protein
MLSSDCGIRRKIRNNIDGASSTLSNRKIPQPDVCNTVAPIQLSKRAHSVAAKHGVQPKNVFPASRSDVLH